MSDQQPPPDAGRGSREPPSAAEDFVIEYDRQRVAAANARATRVLTVSAAVTTFVAVVVAVLSVLMLSTGTGPVTGVIVVALTLVAAALAVRSWRAVLVFRRTAVRMNAVPEALRLTDRGVQFPDPERGGTVVLPWHSIEAARIVTVRAEQVLLLELDPEFTPQDPDARGLDDPEAWKALQRGALGMSGPRFGLRTLRRSVQEIDAGLRAHSGGRIFLS